TPLAAYALLFLAVGVGFIFVHLMAGKLIRPNKPDPEKGTIYECGEPTIGSAWVQFDLRYYVVALLFVVFDVEVAFFFPWAEVFGKANALANVPAQMNTAADYNDFAGKVLDLASFSAMRDPSGPDVRPGAGMDRGRFQALKDLTPEQLQAYQELDLGGRDGQRLWDALRNLPREDYDALRKLTKEQVAGVAGVLAGLE